MGLVRFNITDAGFDVTALYTRRTLKKGFGPFMDAVADAFAARGGERTVIGVSGPPGCGKSTVSAVFRRLLEARGIPTVILPLDGFHLPNAELARRTIAAGGESRPLIERKGAKESYDLERVLLFVKRLRGPEPFTWPSYSRLLHEPVEKGVRVARGPLACILEGNYLFLQSGGWHRLGALFDLKLFILAKASRVRERLVARKARGGFSREEAEAHFRRSDLRNIEEVVRLSSGFDYLLVQKGRYGYRLSRRRRTSGIPRNRAIPRGRSEAPPA